MANTQLFSQYYSKDSNNQIISRKLSGSSNNPIVYSIIVTYNGMPWIERCLNSLQYSTQSTHIIVIDNLSSDGTPDYIEQHFPQVELIRSKENLGFGKGNNIGLKRALDDKADYVFLLNQDAWVKPDTLEQLIHVHTQHPEYGVLSPAHLNGRENGLETKFAEYVSPDNTSGLLSDLFMNQLKQVYTTRFVNAAAWLISRECLQKVGGFDPIFHHYSEDIDYINRSHYHKFKTGIIPHAQITHDTKAYSWNDIKQNKQLRLNFLILHLKNPNSRFRSAFLLMLKKQVDISTTNLLFRKFKEFNTNCYLTFKILTLIKSVRQARKITIKEQAYL